MASVLLEARPYRPFKSSEEYLYAMREDLAEWMNILYPELLINVENFMDRLDTGIALCKHANNVRRAAEDYIVRRQARQKSMTRSMTTGLAGPILSMGTVHYLPLAKSGTFFARDNVSNFIAWCRNCLQIFECLLFETDDLIMRKNEKHVILCLLEVARRGAKFGMLAPMLVQMERQIDREIAADNKANGVAFGAQTDMTLATSIGIENEEFDSDSEEEEDTNGPMLMYGPQPQIVTNDLKSLDEMVRDLVEKCTCPSQFPMIRVSEGKYRIGDTKVLIFVRILRSHVMVRVGGGWDTLSHYLDKHDPCRCRAQHRSSVAAKIYTRTNQLNGIELHKAQVVYERSPPATRKFSTGNAVAPAGSLQLNSNLSPPARNRSRSRSPAQRKSNTNGNTSPESSQPYDKTFLTASPSLTRRSMSPCPRRFTDIRKKQNSVESPVPSASPVQTSSAQDEPLINEAKIENGNGSANNDGANKYENVSDNGSEISDEGYRSLGLVQSNNAKLILLQSQVSNDDADTNGRLDRISPETTTTSSETTSNEIKLDSPISDDSPIAKCGIEMHDDGVDIAKTTGLRKTGFSEVLYEDNPILASKKGLQSRIPKSPMLTRRKSMDNCSEIANTDEDSNIRRIPAYRSVRRPQQPKERVSLKENTWNGRSTSPTNQTKKRPMLTPDTFNTPSRTASLTRNTPARSSHLDARTRQRSSTRASSSVNTSPKKNNNQSNNNNLQSQLAQQLMEAAGKARNDAQILGKIKQILSDYASKNKANSDDDFTTTWVNNGGNLDNSNDTTADSNVSAEKSLSKRSSSSFSASSDSNPTTSSRDPSTTSPRRSDKRISRIPAPVRSNTGLY